MTIDTTPNGFAGKYSTPNYGEVAYRINIEDGVAVWIFSDRRLARDMYSIKKQAGNNNVYFQERINAFGEKFPGKTKQEIVEIIFKEHQELNIHNQSKK
jgi:hypothetical protein